MDSLATVSHLDRCETQRADPDWIAGQWIQPSSLLVTVSADGRVSCAADGGAVSEAPPSGVFDPDRHYLLGRWAGRAVFVESGTVPTMAGLRDLLPALPEAERELVMAAVALVNWHRTSPRCSVCGSATEVRAGGIVRHCPACGRDRFPRTDPAIIVAVLDPDDRLLLGHQMVWPPGRMSLLAGFVSAGESLEQAVRREVAEEAGVTVAAVKYLGSQPWPFPRTLMLGFVARAADTIITADGVEIEHARWFTREELGQAIEAAEVGLPGAASIAHRIIAAWRDGSLAEPE